TSTTTTGGPAATGENSSTPVRRTAIWRWIVRILLVAGACVVTYVWYAGSHVDNHVYGASELANGPITQIVPWHDNYKAVQTSRLTDLPADQIWKVVTDQG